VVVCAIAASPLFFAFGAPDAAAAQRSVSATGATIGLAVTDLRYALYESADGKEECPAGMQFSSLEQFKAMPDPAGYVLRYGNSFSFLGPKGENADYDPLAVTDRLPWKELQTRKGLGINLDGTADGQATDKTCRHEKFTNAEGRPVDNQVARAMGCIEGFRTGGFSTEFYSNEVATSPINRHLIEITGVDSETNDPQVEVTIYKGRDSVIRRADRNAFVPFMTQRVDDLFPQFVLKTHGRIVDGVLTTDPIPLARLPILHVQVVNERRIRDMRLQLKIGPESATGYLGGYEQIGSMWDYLSKSPASATSKYSPAGLYRALQRYADGFPDPATKQCTAISVAYKVNAVRALIVHDRAAGSRVASSAMDAPGLPTKGAKN
jgi:hypothetical protein